MHEYEADVLIVGAGPTGLALANALERLGTSYVVIEAKPGVSVHTKATNLMPGTLEQLDVLGLADRMYETGGVMKRYMVHMYGLDVGPRPMHLGESPHPNVLFLGQDLIDRNLKEALPDAGGRIRFSHSLTALEQDGDGVVATIAAGGGEHRLRFRYVVGCDGPRSVTRQFSKCDFEPVKTGKYVWQVDAKLSWRGLRTMKQMWLYYYDEGFGVVIHLPGDNTKVMVFEEKDRLPNREPTLEEMQSKLRTISGDETATLSDPIWFSHGELLTGVAPALIDGRVILAGDACNPILPNGGQGLNIGIQDALNLAWKLHDVIRGEASPALLQTYDAERRANRLALEKIQISTLKNTLPAPKLNQFILGRYGNAVLDRIWPPLAKAFSQLGVSYEKSPLTLPGGTKKSIRAGQRVRDADVLRASDAAEVSLFKELRSPEWKLIIFDGGVSLPASIARDLASLPQLSTYVIIAGAGTLDSPARVYYDLDRLAHKAYGLRVPTALLIRPDNYTAAVVPVADLKPLRSYLAEWYMRPDEVGSRAALSEATHSHAREAA
ncbi:FAD-dependent monooxygenase [Brevundimonas sp.]|jgi:2-polyprenyl-6-methoxyphenol hydroxylase-like FAD-dependent oxidoreductase|uniref:FAD-dependent monooxygenase n=1 Tax=Brevundimonas sp. TaxID=1871086 RepID=UPI002E0D1E44|nr:FAD-dependent monooxygenase [Brevundimonas sp.]